MPKTPKTVLLLRKARSGATAPVLNQADFPFRFLLGGKAYVVELTRAGKAVMKAE